MVNVEFQNEELIAPRHGMRQSTSSALNSMVIKFGLAKTSEGANRVLLIIAILCFVAAGFLVFSTINGNKVEPPSVIG